jgi:hypothetical protein
VRNANKHPVDEREERNHLRNMYIDRRTVTSLSNLDVLREVEENTALYEDNVSVRLVVTW